MDFPSQWDGYLREIPLFPEVIDKILKVNATSPLQDWQSCLEGIDKYSGYIYFQPSESDAPTFPSRLWTFAHHAAYFNAPMEVIKELRKRKFFFSLKDAEGKQAVDHVSSDASDEYKKMFQPKYKLKNLDLEKLDAIEKQFHEVIRSRCDDNIKEWSLVLPNTLILLEDVFKGKNQYFPVPGMYGGFDYSLLLNKNKSDVVALESSSWCRVVGGSGQRHKCYPDKYELTEEGFV